jgi:ethanolamine transporter EutH
VKQNVRSVVAAMRLVESTTEIGMTLRMLKCMQQARRMFVVAKVTSRILLQGARLDHVAVASVDAFVKLVEAGKLVCGMTSVVGTDLV